MPTLNRCRRAREGAGLSLGQAARVLGVPIDQLRAVEDSDAAYADSDPPRLADVYGVDLDWLSGRSELCDYALVERLPNADRLSFRERDMLAELYASMARTPPTR